MIRPATFVTLLLACSSGAYLFVVKHRAETLDQQLGSVTSQIRLTERRIRVLQAEWASENDPSRLARLSQQFLHLAPMAPNQLVTMNRLAELLPQPGSELPHLPLPPPSPKDMAAPAQPAAPLANAPVASAAPPPAPAAPRVRLASALTVPKLQHPQPLHPVHKAVPAKPMPVAHPVRFIPAPHPYVRQTTPPMGGRVMTVTAERAPIPLMPRFERQASASASFRAAPPPTQAQSVFGGLGADLAPPRPVYRSAP